jgi:hypothetical protein
MKRNLILGSVLLVVAVVAAACGTGGKTAVDYAGVVDGLRGAGATAEAAGEVSQQFLSVKGQAISVNGEQVQVFEYANEAALEADAATVSPDGSTVGTTMITWVATPHFYRSGTVMVLYIGDDAGTLKALERILGPQFAGGS